MLDCTTVQLGNAKTTVVGFKVDRTTARISQTAHTTIRDNCKVSLVQSLDAPAKTTIRSGLRTLATNEATRVILTGVKLVSSSGGGGSAPCDGPVTTTLTYTGDLLSSVDQDGYIKTLGYTGDVLTTITHPTCTFTLSYNPDGTLATVVKS